MSHATCAHCGTEISDHSTMQEFKGQTYCCKNCVAMVSGTGNYPKGLPTCAHCEMPIVEASTKVEADGKTYCCNNCAAAMRQGTPHRAT
jgi:hypothetical protein